MAFLELPLLDKVAEERNWPGKRVPASTWLAPPLSRRSAWQFVMSKVGHVRRVRASHERPPAPNGREELCDWFWVAKHSASPPRAGK